MQNRFRWFMLDQLVPLLNDQDWSVLSRDVIFKIADQVMYRLIPTRASMYGGTEFHLYFDVRPLYWPAHAAALGLHSQINQWGKYLRCSMVSEERAINCSHEIARRTNELLPALLSEMRDSEALLGFFEKHIRARHPWRILESSVWTPAARDWEAYVMAWAGHVHDSAQVLQTDLRSLAQRRPDLRDDIAKERRLLSVLESPRELRVHLFSIVSQMTAELRLDKARPLGPLLERRRRWQERQARRIAEEESE